MPIELKGDVIWFDGDAAARISPHLILTVRQKFEEFLEGIAEDEVVTVLEVKDLLNKILTNAKEISQAKMITEKELSDILEELKTTL